MSPLTAKVAAVPASLFSAGTLGGPLLAGWLLLLLLSLHVMLSPWGAAGWAAARSGPAGAAACAAAAAVGPVGSRWIQQPSTIGS